MELSLSFGLSEIDSLFPGFQQGDFGVIYGSSECLWLSLLLCARIQLPNSQTPTGFPALFVDGGNTFDLYELSKMAKSYGLEPKQALNNVFISRAFTAYQLTALIFDKLKAAVDKYHPKLVVVANVPWLYLDRDVPKTESKDIFNNLTQFLSNFAAENKLVLVATYTGGGSWARTIFYEAALTGRANVVIKTSRSKNGFKVSLEKHPNYKLGTAELLPQETTLTDFLER